MIFFWLLTGVEHADATGRGQQFHGIRESVQPIRQRNGRLCPGHRRPTERSQGRATPGSDERCPHHPRTIYPHASHSFQGISPIHLSTYSPKTYYILYIYYIYYIFFNKSILLHYL